MISKPRLTDDMLSHLYDPTYVKNNLEIRLVPEHKLQEYKDNHRCYMKLGNADFGVGLAIRINNDWGVTVTEDFLRANATDFETLWQTWLSSDADNISIRTMNDMLATFFQPTKDTPEECTPTVPLYVVTYNHNSPGGAAVLHPAVQKKLFSMPQCQNGFYILFSSIFESIIVPKTYSHGSVKELQDMLREINTREDIVATQNVATNFVYECTAPCALERLVFE